MSTSERFQLPQLQPKPRPFGLPRGAEEHQNAFDRRSVSNQRSGSTVAEQQLADVQRQLAIVKAENEKLARSANEWQGEAGRLAGQLRQEDSRPVGQQSVVDRPIVYREANSTYLGGALDAVRHYGTRREDYQTPATVPVVFNHGDSDLQRRINELEGKNKQLLKTNGALAQANQIAEERLMEGQRGEVRRTSYNSDHTQVANAGKLFERNPQAEGVGVERGQIRDTERGAARERSNVNRNAELSEDSAPVKSRGTSDLIWLLPLLLGSLGLNFFLWIHCRTLDLRYNDLADELRGMVGASTTL